MSTPVVTIFVRHGLKDGKPCKYAEDETSKRCHCPKHFRWTQNGVQYRQAAGTRSWEQAEEIKRQLQDKLAGRTPETKPEDKTRFISTAVDLFITDKTVEGVTAGVIKKYTLELKRLTDFCEHEGVFAVQGITRELLTGFCATWKAFYPSSITRSKVMERLRAFLRYCYDAEWLGRVPKTPKIQVDDDDKPPTLPLEGDEYPRLLDALYVVNPRRWDGKKSSQGLTPKMHTRLRGLLQLMRWSGLSIYDAISIEKTELVWKSEHRTYRVTTSRQKTGTDVGVLLPPDLSAELKPLMEAHPVYLFFPETKLNFKELAKTYTNRYIRPAFEAAGIPCDTHMVSHRLRDTFVVDLLNKGVPLEEVAAAIGDTVKTTEKHYAKWVPSRQNRLDSSIAATWKSNPPNELSAG